MAINDITLGVSGGAATTLSAFGRKLTESNIEIARQSRTASGRLVKDIVATKKKFTLAYSTITGTALQEILDLYDEESVLELIVNDPTLGPGTYDVHMQPIDYTRIVLLDDGLWSGVSVVLEEV